MIHKLKVSVAAGSLLMACTAACSPKNPNSTVSTTTPSPATIENNAAAVAAGTTPPSSDVSTPDDKTKTFVEKAALTDMFEIAEAKIVLSRSSSQPIKDFAQMLIDDHQAITSDLGPLAKAAGVIPPTALDSEHEDKIDALQKAPAAYFDTKYLDQQEEAHAAALDLMKDYAQNGTDAALQAFATRVSGKIEQHLQKAKALDKNGADKADAADKT